MRFMEQALLKSLRELQCYCELILYSYLPRAFIEKLISSNLPEFNNIFSYIISGEDMVEVNDYKVKDMAPLMMSRASTDIIIVDTQAERIDDEIFSSIIVSEYNGSVSYNNQLILLKLTLKQINEQ
jgi:hypothetical protein